MSPINRYFGGHGKKVMKDMKSRYGKKKGEQVFYATAASRGDKHFYGHLASGSIKPGVIKGCST